VRVLAEKGVQVLSRSSRERMEYRQATALLREGLTIFRVLGAAGEIGMCLQALALIAVAQGEHERAAWLFGASEARRDALATVLARKRIRPRRAP
jgi:hypothetical protein